MSEYRMLKPRNEIVIRGLYSLHYFQFASGYVFEGEKHNFWEMVYIDRGEAEIGADSEIRRLDAGQLLFHQPNEFHTIWADYASGANIFVISFDCKSRAMNMFRSKQFTLRSPLRKGSGCSVRCWTYPTRRNCIRLRKGRAEACSALCCT